MPARPDRSRAHSVWPRHPARGAHARRPGVGPWWQRLDDPPPVSGHGAHARRRGVGPWWQHLDDPPSATKPTATDTAAPSTWRPVRPRHARRKPLDHPGVLVALLLTAIALPLAVVIERMDTAAALPDVVQVSSVKGAARSEPRVLPSPASPRPTTTLAPTTAPPPTAPPTTAPTSIVTTTSVQPTTTTTAAPTTQAPTTTTRHATAAPATARPLRPAAPAARAPEASETGQGTWYDYEPGGCANNTLPKGTRVTVTNLSSGATTTCVVNDRGTFGPPRILDMDRRVFAQIADPSTGVIPIRISW